MLFFFYDCHNIILMLPPNNDIIFKEAFVTGAISSCLCHKYNEYVIGGKMGREENRVSGNKSQSAMLHRLVRQAFIAVGIGAALLLGFIVLNIGTSSINSAQLNTMSALNQYRIGSRTLTYEIQSYAATGEEGYYDDYMKELNVDQNREQAIETLHTCGISKKEWERLNSILLCLLSMS